VSAYLLKVGRNTSFMQAPPPPPPHPRDPSPSLEMYGCSLGNIRFAAEVAPRLSHICHPDIQHTEWIRGQEVG
jgi:hypothetical protein